MSARVEGVGGITWERWRACFSIIEARAYLFAEGRALAEKKLRIRGAGGSGEGSCEQAGEKEFRRNQSLAEAF